MDEKIKQILQLAVYAPSGDNIQPWRFEVKQNDLFVYNIPEKDTTLYNYKQHGSFIAHGALLENISIISPAFGLLANINILQNADPNLIANISFTETQTTKPPLFPYIKKRFTNRKPYKNTPLTDIQKETLLNLTSFEQPSEVLLIDTKAELKTLAKAISQGDRLIFENKTIHDFLFSHIRWTEEEEIKYKNGLYLKTMELSKGQQAAFKLFKSWKIMKIFNALGMPKMAVKGNEKVYSNGPILGAITISSNSPADYVELGRIFQRLWLTVTSLNLSLQPLTAVPLVMQKIFDGDTKELSGNDINIIKNSYEIASALFKNKTLGLMFRIGNADAPTATSSRLEPEIKFTK